MYVGEQYAGQTFADYTGNYVKTKVNRRDGNGHFLSMPVPISVWVKDGISPAEAFDETAVEEVDSFRNGRQSNCAVDVGFSPLNGGFAGVRW